MSAMEKLRAAAPVMLEDLAELVGTESPSADVDAIARCADVVAELGRRCTGQAPERIVVADRPHLRWRFGSAPPRVVLIGHFDTVWPLGTLTRWPFAVDGDRATGPGVVDMKAGLVMLFHALAQLDDLDGVAVVANSDEEIGSPTSTKLIEDTARGAAGALVLEGSAEGRLKVARKGIAHYSVRVVGRAAHAGVAPHLGINAGVELAHQILRITELGDAERTTTVTPTDAVVGTTSNTVPAEARLSIDARSFDPAELARVDAALRDLRPVLPGAQVRVEPGPSRPAMPEAAATELFALAQRLGAELGLPPFTAEAVGGGSDGNLTAGVGVRTLDGLGAVGGKAHAEGEWIDLTSLPDRAALVCALAGAIGRDA
ncbi:M20 family metallopeptidase [Dactylosporangium roseum]|uniref:M20 family metallopeptidase n=1 Tax=Dactylosporangium roseum TaxID=47989 RepID=A0ABY5YZV2_9ACTN|nr:M20 family metallopeptidase [Dactylosporangium roseum]UWZ34891.1 M20 family metallopeptidase [Dactylosporangium roseum]